MAERVDRFDVAFPLLSFNPSGGVRMVIHVANTLAARGRSVVVSVPADAASPPIPLRDGVTLRVRRSTGGLRNRASFVSDMPKAGVYVATGYQTPLLIQAAVRGRAPIVYLIQNDEPVSHVTYGTQPAWAKPALRAWARAGFGVRATRIAVSGYVAGRVGQHRIHRVVPPGIDPEFINLATRSDDRVRNERRAQDARVVVGTLVHPGRIKGMDVALDAFARLRTTPSIRFIAFDGAYRVPVAPEIETFSLVATNAHVAHDMPTFLSYLDVFVFPSWIEGFGIPPLEAMACGAAVVVTDSGGVREYAQDGDNCLLVPAGNAAAIAQAIERLTVAPGAPELRARLVRGGRTTALQFPVERFVNACADEIERRLR